MKKYLTITVSFFVFVLCYAGTYSPEDIDYTRINNNQTRVVNPDLIISGVYCDSIDSVLLSLDSLGVQCVAAVCEHFKGDDPYEFAIGLGRHLGVGSKKNQGIVIALATKDRSYWISTGEGMEKFLPDIVCKNIEDLYFIPYLKDSLWNEAMLSVSRGIHGYIVKNPQYIDELKLYEEKKSNGSSKWTFLAIIAGIIGGIRYLFYRKKRKEKLCPYCNQYEMEQVSKETIDTVPDQIRYKITYKCNNCGQYKYKDIIHYISEESGTIAGGAVGGSIGSRSRGGSIKSGPFSGMGGGRFGGGGAGGRF